MEEGVGEVVYLFDLTSTFEVTDTIPPKISAPTFTYEEGTTGHQLRWTLEDTDPGSYTLYNNSVLVQYSNTWTNGETIEFNIDGLAVGTYNFTMVVCDVYGTCASDTVWVVVVAGVSTPAPIPVTLFSEMLWMLPLTLLIGTFIIKHQRRKKSL